MKVMERISIDWLVEVLYDRGYLNTKPQTGSVSGMNVLKIVNQAKEIFKNEIVEAGNNCALKSTLHRHRIDQMTLEEIQEHLKNDPPTTFGEEYFQEKYKQ